jgi:chromosome segregation and condensation protein ScpB
VAQDGAKLVIDASAPVAKEVLDYLVHEHSYGNRETRTGKAVEGRFAGVGYGWEREVLQLVLAALFRAGAVDVTYQGTQFRNYQDPASRAPFTNLGPFRAALFSPREALGLKALTTAVEQLEDLTGEEVDVEEGAIATAFQRVANEELERLYPLRALAEAHRLPVVAMLDEYQQTLQGIRSSASDDCVRTLVEAGAAFAVTRTKVRRLRETLNDEALSLLQDARAALQHVWPQLRVRGPAEDVAAGAEELEVLLAPEDLPEVIVGVARCVEALLGAFRAAYADLFDRRASGYAQAIDDVKGRPEWGALAGTRPEVAASVLEPLQARIGSPEERVGVIEGAGWRSASLLAMESDLAAVEALRAAALARLQEMALGDATERPVRRVRIADILARPIHSKDDLDAAIEQLRDALQKFIDEGDAIILE